MKKIITLCAATLIALLSANQSYAMNEDQFLINTLEQMNIDPKSPFGQILIERILTLIASAEEQEKLNGQALSVEQFHHLANEACRGISLQLTNKKEQSSLLKINVELSYRAALRHKNNENISYLSEALIEALDFCEFDSEWAHEICNLCRLINERAITILSGPSKFDVEIYNNFLRILTWIKIKSGREELKLNLFILKFEALVEQNLSSRYTKA